MEQDFITSTPQAPDDTVSNTSVEEEGEDKRKVRIEVHVVFFPAHLSLLYLGPATNKTAARSLEETIRRETMLSAARSRVREKMQELNEQGTAKAAGRDARRNRQRLQEETRKLLGVCCDNERRGTGSPAWRWNGPEE